MKINIEFDVDYIEGKVEDKIINKIAAAVEGKIKDSTVNQIVITMHEQINGWITQTLNEFIDRPINLTDRYGEIIEKYACVKDLLKSKFDAFMSESVDEQGRSVKQGCYGPKASRLHWMVGEAINAHSKKTYANAKKEMEVQIKRKFDDFEKKLVQDSIDAIIKNLDLDKIAKSKLLKQ